MRVQRITAVGGNNIRSAEVASKQTGFPARVGKVLYRGRLETDLLAIGLQGALHLRAFDPPLLTVCGAHQEPIGTALDNCHVLATIDHVKNRVTAAWTRPHFEVRVGDRHRTVIIRCLRRNHQRQ